MNCLGCQFHPPGLGSTTSRLLGGREIQPELVRQLGSTLSKMGTEEVILCGEGEPFLHPELFAVIRSLKEAGLRVQLYTNGTLLDKKNVSSVLESELDVLKVSLWASSEEEYTQCYPHAKIENFEKTMRGIQRMTRMKEERRKSRPNVILTGPINRINSTRLDERIRMAAKLGCNGVAFTPFKHRRGAFASVALSNEEAMLLRPGLIRAKRHLASLSMHHNIDTLLLQYRLGENAWRTLPCYAGWFHSHIRFDGTVMPCCRCETSLGNLNEKGFEKIWNGPAYRRFRTTCASREGLFSLSEVCDCSWCNLVADNSRVHRYFKRFSPLRRRSKE